MMRIVIPLLGVQLAPKRVKLDDLTIRQFSASDRKLLDGGLLAKRLLSRPHSDEIDDKLWRTSATLPFKPNIRTRKINGRSVDWIINVPEMLGLNICTALRLISDAWCSAPLLYVVESASVPWESSTEAYPEQAWASRPHSFDQHLTIQAREVTALRTLWPLLQRALKGRNPGLWQAVMAFNRSWSYRPIDAAECIAELMRGLEALLVYESVEVSYRLGVRCACLLSHDPAIRTSIRMQLKAGYNVRSKVVHGASIPRAAKIEGSSVQLRDLASRIRHILRSSIGSFLLLLQTYKEDEIKKTLLDEHILFASRSAISEVLRYPQSIRVLGRLGEVTPAVLTL